MTNNFNENDFWIQPAKGFTGDYQALTESDIDRKQAQLGIKFPSRYRQLMLIQNGGYVRRRSYNGGSEPLELFINGATLEPLHEVYDFYYLLTSFLYEDQIEAAKSEYEHCHPDRLIMFSGLYGDGFAGFDYGWLLKKPTSEPNVVVYEQDELPFGYKEILRVADFDKFLENLVYYGCDSDSYFMAVKTLLSQNNLINVIKKIWGGDFKRHEDDRYGWFNFDSYHIGKVAHLVKYQSLLVVVSPNQHRSGTYLFQHLPDFNFIIDIKENYLDEDISFQVKKAAEALNSAIDGDIELLDFPYPFGKSST